MVFVNKKFTLILIFTLTVSGLLLVEPCMAPVTVPTNSKSGPEIISVEIHNDPIWVPPVTTTHSYIDMNTGEIINEEITHTLSGYWKPNGSIVITVKNQPFTPYTDTNNNTINVYYTIFYKTDSPGLFWEQPCIAVYQSDSKYTVITFAYGSRSMQDWRTHVYITSEGEIVDFRI
jgi:hypothetical protein